MAAPDIVGQDPTPTSAIPGWLPVDPDRPWEPGTFTLAFSALVALAFWLLAADVVSTSAFTVDVVSAALATAVLLVAPLGLARTTRAVARPGRGFAPSDVGGPAILVALAVNGAFDDIGALVGGAWLLVSALLLAQSVTLRGWRPPKRDGTGVADADMVILAHAYLVIGAGWLTIHLAGWQPMGFDPDIVELTALHFHFAGFGALLIARDVHRWTLDAAPSTANLALGLVAVAPAVIAVGFATSSILQTLGAVCLAVGLWLSSWLTLRHVVREDAATGAIRALLVVVSIVVLAPMGLAVHWAAGQNFGFAALSIPDMARVHGIANVVFTVVGLFTWGALYRRDAWARAGGSSRAGVPSSEAASGDRPSGQAT